MFCVALLIVREIGFGKHSFLQIIGCAIGFVIAIIIAITANRISDAIAVVFIVLIGKTDINRILKITQRITIILVLFIIASSIIGVIPSIVFYRENALRYSLGFRYVLYLPTYIFNIIAIYIYLNREKMSYAILFFWALIALCVYVLTISRLAFYSTLFLILYSIRYVKKNKHNLINAPNMKRYYLIIVPIFFVIALLSVYLIVNYNPNDSLHLRMNKLLGGRLSISNLSYQIYGYSMFGNNKIDWVGQSYDALGEKAEGTVTFVDNVYFNILQRYGIVVWVCLLFLLTLMVYRCYKRNDKLLFTIFMVLAIHGFIDNLVEYIHYNSFLFFIYLLCFNREDKEQKRDNGFILKRTNLNKSIPKDICGEFVQNDSYNKN